jgi:transcriptional regulator with XRE-family HTH domain
MTQTAADNLFVQRIRAEMKEQNLSIRGLARRMDPDNLNRARRNLHRWLDEGIVPGRASRDELAEALGIPPDEIAPARDMDPFASLGESIADVLRTQVQAAVEQQLSRVTVAA